MRRLSFEVVKVVRAEIAADKALLFAKMQPILAAGNLAIVQPGPDQVADRLAGRRAQHLVLPNTTRAFWKVGDGRRG